MLLSLKINNIALIDEVNIKLGNGFHVLTGETGAGKSIIVDALNLIIGGRTDKSLIRSSCNDASVEASISIKDINNIKDILDREMISYQSDIIDIYRKISVSGRNICRVCGEPVSLHVLKEIMENVVDILGQHSSTLLLNESNQLTTLDDFGNVEHFILLNEVKKKYTEWYKSSVKLKKLLNLSKEKELLFEKTNKELEELDSAKIKINEEDELYNRRLALQDLIKVKDALKLSYYNLYGFADSESILQKLKECIDRFQSIKDLSDQYKNIYESLNSSYFELENDLIEIRDIRENFNFNDDEELKINERLELIKHIKRKYGSSYEEINKKHLFLQNRMDAYTSLDDSLKIAQKEYKDCLNDYRIASQNLSDSRQKISRQFEDNITNQLHSLGIKEAQFIIDIERDQNIKPKILGNDNVVFTFTSNKGEPLKPIRDAASGGELSRIMLALKTIEANKNKIPCLIFDEVDTGISGKAAQIVAEKIAYISKYRQVFAVSHLAQIASMADIHFYVSKSDESGRTVTDIELLDDTKRRNEVARLLGLIEGNEESALVHADNMLSAAIDYKTKL